MKKYFISLFIGLILFIIAIFVFSKSVYIAPVLITIGLILTVFSLIKLSKEYNSVKALSIGLLEFISNIFL